jgi:4-amino-4-deoxy-L-arabinose transferase-like glycosyltransferase
MNVPQTKNKPAAILAIAIFIWGVALRAVEILNKNYLFGFDQGRDYMAAYSILKHKLTLIGAEVGAGSAGISGLFHGPGYYYLIAFMEKIWHGDPYGGLVLMFIFGVGTLMLIYATSKILIGRLGALFALLFISISPNIVSQSRFVWNHHPSTFFVVLSYFFLYKSYKSPKVYFPLALFTAAFIYHFELAIAVPLVIAIILSGIFVIKIRSIRVWIYSFISIAVAFLPMIIFESRHNFMAIRSMFSYNVSMNHASGNPLSLGRFLHHLPFYVGNFFGTFTFEFGMIPARLQQLSVLIVLPFTVFTVFKESRKTKEVYAFVCSLFVIMLFSWVFFLFLNNAIWDYYLTHVRVAFIYIFALGGSYIFNSHIKVSYKIVTRILFVIFVGILFTGTVFRMYISYSQDFSDYGRYEKIKGKIAAIDYVYSDAGPNHFNAFVYMPPIYTYPYDYLFLTRGNNRYGFVPGKEKSGLTYLIIEPDNQQIWYKGWIDTVMSGGQILSEQELPSGQIIQKRLYK